MGLPLPSDLPRRLLFKRAIHQHHWIVLIIRISIAQNVQLLSQQAWPAHYADHVL